MEFFDGLALDRWTAPPRQLPSIFIATAKALEKMHKADLVHCDIKPANILANEASEIRVIDLGQTCRIGTRKHRLQGTPDFISPEQARLDPVTPRTDIYNLGATMYRLLTGKNLPTILTPNGRLHEPPAPTPPHAINPQVSEALSKLVLECVRSDPQQRPPNMAAVIQALEALNHRQ
jgi:serine/threonine-protein kinase